MVRIKLVMALIGAWSLFRAEATGEVLRVEGEILGASLPWTDGLFDEQEGPLWEFPSHVGPVPYAGLLTVDAENQLASFHVSISSCIPGAGFCLAAADLETGIVDEDGAPTTYRLVRNLYEGVVRDDASEVEIAYTSPRRPEEWVTSFALVLDRTTGTGEWRWNQGPAQVCAGEICAPSVPGNEARATISGFRVVPEPISWALVLCAGMLATPARLRRTDAGARVRRVGGVS